MLLDSPDHFFNATNNVEEYTKFRLASKRDRELVRAHAETQTVTGRCARCNKRFTGPLPLEREWFQHHPCAGRR